MLLPIMGCRLSLVPLMHLSGQHGATSCTDGNLEYLGQIESKFCHVRVCVSICAGRTEIRISHVSMEVNTTLLPI